MVTKHQSYGYIYNECLRQYPKHTQRRTHGGPKKKDIENTQR